MSNFLTIATVTETLRRQLLSVVPTDVPLADVSARRPDAPVGAQAPRINIYLYQVSPNAAFRNADLPTRREDGSVIQRPRSAFDLHYLLTFYGDESELVPQRLVGSVVRSLHTRPVITHAMIQDTKANVGFLAASNLDEEIESVKFTPLPLSLEELSKLWSVFFQVPYMLSLAYHASVVFIDATISAGTALPVRERNLYVVPFRSPVIERVVAATGANEPILATSTLRIIGRQLRGEITNVRLGGNVFGPLAAAVVNDHEITLDLTTLPVGSLRAGAQGLQIVQQRLMGTPKTLHRGVESNVAALVLRPRITKDGGGNYEIAVANILPDTGGTLQAEVTVNLDPQVGPRQRVILILNGSAQQYVFEAEPRNLATTSVEFNVSRIVPGNYVVRVQVDGGESLLDFNAATNTFDKPEISII